jgi:hypothetical protein
LSIITKIALNQLFLFVFPNPKIVLVAVPLKHSFHSLFILGTGDPIANRFNPILQNYYISPMGERANFISASG